jgi:hypothetical protein
MGRHSWSGAQSGTSSTNPPTEAELAESDELANDPEFSHFYL